MRSFACILALAVLTSASAQAAQIPERLTLAAAEKRALNQHPAIDAGAFDALALRERVNQTRAERRPLATASFTAVGADNGGRIGAGALNNPVIYSRLGTGVHFNQLLFDFGRTSRLIDSGEARAAAANERVKVSRAEVILSVRRAYYTALRTQTLLQVAQATVEARQLVADQIGELVKAQLKSSLDLSVVQTNVAEAKLLLAAAENERRAAHARLAEAMGQQMTELYELAEEPMPPIEPLAISELRVEALRNRPELAAMRLESESATQLAAAESSFRYPHFSVVGSTGVLPQRAENMNAGYVAAGLNVSLPFLNGGLYKSRQAEAELQARAADRRIREIENRIVRDVTIAWLDLNNARDRLTLTAQFVEQARQAVELAQARYDLGLSSVIELSQAQLVQTNAEIQHATARYDLQIQRALLDYETGLFR